MIELLTDNHKSKVMSAFENSKKSICIISPFLTVDTAKVFAKTVKNKNISATMITRFDHSAFVKDAKGRSANSVQGLKIMQAAGIDLFAVLDLHTKLYLIDDEIGIVGSANFTKSGMERNVELSLYIEKEPDLLDGLREYFEDIKAECVKQDKSITEKLLTEEEARIKNECKSSKTAGPCEIKNPPKPFGAKIEPEETGDFVQELVDPKIVWDSDVWVKFEASSVKRRQGTEFFKDTHGPTLKTFFSPARKPKRVHEGNLIYIAVHSYDKDNKLAPMIVARAKAHEFQKENYDDSRGQWPFYLELYDMEILPGALQDGLSLYKLVEECGKNTYMHTKSKTTEFNVLYSHRQQACLGLAEQAQKYLQEYFDEHLKG